MNNNEPKAFPGLGQDGLTMRDYFAAKAMSAFLLDQMHALDGVAADAYEMADAMMRARGEG